MLIRYIRASCLLIWDPAQVAKVRSLVSLPPDPVKLHMDAWAIKKLISLALRRSGAKKDVLPQRKDCGSDLCLTGCLVSYTLHVVLQYTA